MLRCEICSGYATAGLAHLHGLSVHLCMDCTRNVVEQREMNEALDSFKRELSRIAAQFVAERYEPQAA